MKKGVMFLILLLFPIFTYAGFFGLDIPPGVAPGAVCLKTGCNMSGSIDMNNNTIYNAIIENGSFSGSVNGSDVVNPTWVEKSGDTMSGTLNMDSNDITNVNNLYASKYYSGDWSNVTIYEAQILDLTHIPDTHVAAVGPFLSDDATNMYFDDDLLNTTIENVIGASTITVEDIWVNETGDTMTGDLNMSNNSITNVYFLGFENNGTYFQVARNGTNTTLELWVNGVIQQDWGASTTVYQEATFLDNIFGDGSTLLNVCLPSGLTVNGDACNATSIFNVDEIWINNLNGNATFNESKLNYTIDLRDGDYCRNGNCSGPLNFTGPSYVDGDIYMNGTLFLVALNATLIDVINLSAEYINAIEIVVGTVTAINMTTERLTASIIWADYATIVNMTVENLNASKIFTEEFVVNGSVTGLCLTNGTGCQADIDTHVEGVGPYLSNDSTKMYFDDALLNLTIDQKIDATSHVHRPDACAVVTGTLDGGDVNSMWYIGDNDLLNVSEVVGSPGFNIECNYTVDDDFNGIELYVDYTGNHEVDIELWNYNTNAWVHFGAFSEVTGFEYITKAVPDFVPYVSGGQARARIYHTSSGSPAHDIFLDFFVLVFSSGGVSSGVSGVGIAGYIPLWLDATDLTNSIMQQVDDTIVVNGDIQADNLCLTNGTGCPNINGTHSVGAGSYLYNVNDGNKTNIYINETVLIETIDNRTGIFELNFTVNAVSGVGTNASVFAFPRLSEILEVTVTPTTLTNKYRVHINGSSTGTVVDQDRIPHVGEWSVAHRGSLVQSETVSAYISEATIDELFIIKLRYRQ